VWSELHYDLTLDPGPMKFIHEFASLPLMPGVYNWCISVNDGHRWFEFTLAPGLSVVSKDDSHVGGHLKGLLNLPTRLQIQADAGGAVADPVTGECAVGSTALS